MRREQFEWDGIHHAAPYTGGSPREGVRSLGVEPEGSGKEQKP